MGVESRRPWFVGIDLRRKYNCLITRLRSVHVCMGDHFLKINWTLPLGCECEEEFESLKHLLNHCPLLSPGISHFFSYLCSRFEDFQHDNFSLVSLVFSPGRLEVAELGKFFSSVNILI